MHGMIVNYPLYKDGAPGAAGMSLDKQNLKWVIPYHPGAVKALKESGIWKAEHDAYNDALIKRQNLLVATWADFMKANPAEATFRKDWMAFRAAALTKAGVDVIFE